MDRDLKDSFAAVLTAALVWWLVAGWGLLGAAYGFLAGNVACAAGLWVAFLASFQRHRPDAHPKTHPEADPMTMGLDSISTPVTGVLSRRIDRMLGRPRPNSTPSARPLDRFGAES